MKLSILICTALKNDLLFNCIRSIKKYTSKETLSDIDFRICYTDVGNTEGLKKIDDFLKTEIKLPYQIVTRQYHYSKCNNLLSEFTNAEYLMFLNDDVEFTEDSISNMLKVISNDGTIGQVGLKLLYPNGNIQHYGQIVYADCDLNMVGVSHYGLNYPNIETHDIFAQGVTAACCIVRNEHFKSVGGFDEGYNHAFQDVQLSWDIRKLGLDIICVGESSAIHHESVSRGKNDICENDIRRMVDYYNANKSVVLDGKSQIFDFRGKYNNTIVILPTMR